MEKDSTKEKELIALLRQDAKQGWLFFVNEYSNIILQTIRKFAFDYDECMEIYVLTCEKLSGKNCSRLKQFKGEGEFGKCQFTTWLIATVINFARQWLRQKKGRKRLFEAVKQLSEFDQHIFDLYYWQNYQQSEIVEILSNRSDNRITEVDVYRSLNRIRDCLTRKNRWKIITGLFRRSSPLSIDSAIDEHGESYELQKALENESNPELQYVNKEFSNLIRKAIQALPEEERNILKLRFEKNLSAREIAFILKIDKYKNVYIKLEAILEKVKADLKENGFHF